MAKEMTVSEYLIKLKTEGGPEAEKQIERLKQSLVNFAKNPGFKDFNLTNYINQIDKLIKAYDKLIVAQKLVFTPPAANGGGVSFRKVTEEMQKAYEAQQKKLAQQEKDKERKKQKAKEETKKFIAKEYGEEAVEKTSKKKATSAKTQETETQKQYNTEKEKAVKIAKQEVDATNQVIDAVNKEKEVKSALSEDSNQSKLDGLVVKANQDARAQNEAEQSQSSVSVQQHAESTKIDTENINKNTEALKQNAQVIKEANTAKSKTSNIATKNNQSNANTNQVTNAASQNDKKQLEEVISTLKKEQAAIESLTKSVNEYTAALQANNQVQKQAETFSENREREAVNGYASADFYNQINQETGKVERVFDTKTLELSPAGMAKAAQLVKDYGIAWNGTKQDIAAALEVIKAVDAETQNAKAFDFGPAGSALKEEFKSEVVNKVTESIQRVNDELNNSVNGFDDVKAKFTDFSYTMQKDGQAVVATMKTIIDANTTATTKLNFFKRKGNNGKEYWATEREFTKVQDNTYTNEQKAAKQAEIEENNKATSAYNEYTAAVKRLFEAKRDLIKARMAGATQSDAVEINKNIEKAQEEVDAKKKVVEATKRATDAQKFYNQQQDKFNAYTELATLNTNRLGSSFGNLRTQIITTARHVIEYGLAYKIFNYSNQLITQTIEKVKELDKLLTEIQMVSGSTDTTVRSMMASYAKMANELGSTVTDVAEGSVEFLRQGRSVAETEKLLRASTMLSKVAMIEATDATTYLTAAMNGYGLSVEQVTQLVDKFVAVDMRYATSSEEIATALQYVASAANEAGISIDKLIGLITIGSATTRLSAETIGQMWKTLVSRLHNVKIGNFLSDDGEDLSNVETALKSVGIALRDTTGEWRNAEDVIDEIGKKWDTLTSVQKSNITTQVAGVRQGNIFIATMQNYDKVIQATNVSLKSQGEATQRYEHYLDSVEAKLNELTTAWQTFALNLNLEGAYAGAIQGLTTIVTILDKIINFDIKGLSVGLLATCLMITNGIRALGASMLKGAAATAEFKVSITDLAAQLKNATLNSAEYNAALNSIVISAAGVKPAIVGQQLALAGVEKEAALAAINMMGYSEAERKAAIEAYKAATATTVLSTAVKAATIAISVIASIVIAYTQHVKELREENQQLAQTYDTTQSEISNYITKLNKLYKLEEQNGKLTESQQDEYKSLLETLKTTYGEDFKLIDTKNAKLQETLETLRKIKIEEAKRFLNDANQKDLNAAMTTVSQKEIRGIGTGLKADTRWNFSIKGNEADKKDFRDAVAKELGLDDNGQIIISGYQDELETWYLNAISVIRQYSEQYNVNVDKLINNLSGKIHLQDVRDTRNENLQGETGIKAIFTTHAIDAVRNLYLAAEEAVAEYTNNPNADNQWNAETAIDNFVDYLRKTGSIDLSKGEYAAHLFKQELKSVEPILTTHASTVETTTKKYSEMVSEVKKLADSYGTLIDAVDEYNSQGYFSIDTLDSLLELLKTDAELLNALDFSNGIATLDKSKYIDLVRAKLDATLDTLGLSNEQLQAFEKTFANLEKALNAQDAQKAFDKWQKQLNHRLAVGELTEKEYYEKLLKYTKKYLKNKAELEEEYWDAYEELYSKRMELAEKELSAERDAIIKSIEDKIETLEKEKEALDKTSEAEDLLLATEKARDNYEKAKNQRNTRVFTETAGWQWVADQEAIENASNELKEAETEYQEKLIDEQINQWNQLKDKYSDAADNIGKSLEEITDAENLLKKYSQKNYSEMESYLTSYTNKVRNMVDDVKDALNVDLKLPLSSYYDEEEEDDSNKKNKKSNSTGYIRVIDVDEYEAEKKNKTTIQVVDYDDYYSGKFTAGTVVGESGHPVGTMNDFRYYATGIENGAVNYTGPAMLHGTPSNPEYVLTSKQMENFVRNMSTTSFGNSTNEAIGGCTITNSNFNLTNVKEPNDFFPALQQIAKQTRR